MKKWTLLSICILLTTIVVGQNKHVELGNVEWLRNYDEAIKQAEIQKKDIFLFFQEVPGCSTCKNYGINILEHPLIVEAIEDLFIPLAIFNNRQGHDEQILKKFKEPAWNNPVARIITAEGKNLVPRLSGQYNGYAVTQLIIGALIENGQEVPGYLRLLSEELQSELLGTKETVISMYCFWTGEKNIGRIKGVSHTEAGFMDGKEVVKVRYSPDLVSYDKILNHASSTQCASSVYTDDVLERDVAHRLLGKTKTIETKAYRKDREDKYYLIHSDLKFLPLTSLQKTKINSMLGDRLDPSSLLSPRQITMLSLLSQRNTKENSLVAVEFRKAWIEFNRSFSF